MRVSRISYWIAEVGQVAGEGWAASVGWAACSSSGR